VKTAVFLRRVVTGYTCHLLANWKVGTRGIVVALFHFIHGIIPVKYTSHNYWGFTMHGKKEKKI
jgi:hypothetical protein